MPTTDPPRFPNPFAPGAPPATAPESEPEPWVRFVPDPLAGPEYAVRSARPDAAAVAVVIRGSLSPSDWRWDGRARCPYVALWAVEEAAEELRRHGFEVRVGHREPVDLDGALREHDSP
ncbi:hypothetical protein [Nocardia farcinica]|uniref:hypothetical protein n=1 Tax=Nocardia farcinica TaxID=37329 RepID=UPI001895FABB|nr:hypothetical protein [Nocardia farcinica]MBF6070138.1 hypothetical protein [Nocardia farcinica]